MNRIAIIGLQGAGKSTFANKLGKKLNRSVVHLDKEYHLSNWSSKYSKEEWINFQKQLVSQETWIIDGNYKSTIDIRLDAADTIFFFDFPRFLCIYRVFKRLSNRGESFDKPKGMREKISLKLIFYILTYPNKEIRKKIKNLGNKKRVVVFKNSKQVNEFVDKIQAA